MLVILDRDGVINQDSAEYIKSPVEWQAIPGSLEAIARLNQAGHTVVIASNQSGLGRGYYDLATLHAIHAKMLDELQAVGGHIAQIYFCPHHPNDGCACRKPKPGMLQQIAEDYSEQWMQRIFIGDTMSDLLASQSMDCPFILVKSGKGTVTLSQLSTDALQKIRVCTDLAAAVQELLRVDATATVFNS